MASTKRTFRMFVEEELGIFPHFVVWAILEWMLIISLYLDNLLSIISNKFADVFELDPPCVLCTRVDHAICGKNPNLYYNESICESHKKDISSLAYCHVHRELSDIRTMCEGCLLSYAVEKESDDSDSNYETDNDDDNNNKKFLKPKKKNVDHSKIDKVIEPGLCSCCGDSLKPKEPNKEFSRSLSSLRSSSFFPTTPRAVSSPRAFSSLAPTSSPRSYSQLAPASPRTYSSLFPNSSPRTISSLAPMSQNRVTDLKFVSDKEPDMPEDQRGSNVNVKREMNEDVFKTPSNIKGNKLFNIPLSEQVSNSPRIGIKPPKKTHFDKLDLFSEPIEESSTTTNGYSILQQLKKQVGDNKRTLITLFMELDEERSAATVAANNAMAMITRLQAEKAGVHMEALQYQRMMDEQAEFDEEAIQILKDLLLKKEEDVRVLEAELDTYRDRYGEIKKVNSDGYEEYYDDLQTRSLSSSVEKLDSNSVVEDHNVKGNNEETSINYESERSHLFEMLKDFEKHVHSSSQKEHKGDSNETTRDNASLRREVNILREKLATIEAESGFLKKTAMALEKGDEGTKLLTEIAEHLRKLQSLN
ncbi:probable myosin-binding protein 6 [Rutidosis leptorrhynchoides]|uniref:probable myosin-binding protein 6 n=1 Tax=Rutidosis leptorrhynchoides TaxID=125765 RepID=UPI003A994DA9